MKFYLNLFIILGSLLCFAQQQKIDSLILELEVQNGETISKLKILNQLANSYQYTNPELGLGYAENAIELAKTLKLKDEEILAYKYKAYNYTALSKDSLAIATYDRIIKIQTERKKWSEVAKATYNKGLLLHGQSYYNQANTCNRKAYEIFEREKDSFLMSVVLNSIGINEMYLSLYPEAIENFLKASTLNELTNKTETNRHAAILTNIGILYVRLEKYDRALNYYNKSLEISKKLNAEYEIANLYTNIGNLYDGIDQPQKAIDYYQQSFDIMKRINDDFGIASALANTGIAYISLKNYDKALSYLTRTIPLFKALNNTNSLAITYESIGTAHFENAAESTTKKSLLTKAKLNFEKALMYATEINSIVRKASAFEKLAQVNYQLNDFKSAYLHKNEAEKLKDSVMSSEKKEEIAKLEAKYEYEKKEVALNAIHDKEQALKEVELTQHKLMIKSSIIGVSVLAIAAIISFILYRRKQEAKVKAKEAEFNLKVSDTELKALRAQMNPHFIFNSLNSINSYIAKNDTENATNYLTKFSKLMRETLEKSAQKEITLNEDIHILKTYMDIENKRSNNSFKYKIMVDDAIDPENALIPPMILQPFVENSIIHGLRDFKQDGIIHINYKKEKEMMVCSIEDNGVGRAKSSLSKTTSKKQSLGVSITKSRIEILNKIKNTKGDVTIIDKPNGTRIEVKLPLTLAF
ncbi:MAG: tetratricopeptide repeat protein [Winogradskyella sp.]|uniref:tetratricopeptide repeat-containing sensor histidine kinase n=1 Tax=Winogradskyella sp. TaxID=1883156 RepID=UPI00385F9A6C